MSDLIHVRLDDDTAPWAALIGQYFNWSMAKVVNNAIRAYVHSMDKTTLEELQSFETRVKRGEAGPLPAPKAKRVA